MVLKYLCKIICKYASAKNAKHSCLSTTANHINWMISYRTFIISLPRVSCPQCATCVMSIMCFDAIWQVSRLGANVSIKRLLNQRKVLARLKKLSAFHL